MGSSQLIAHTMPEGPGGASVCSVCCIISVVRVDASSPAMWDVGCGMWEEPYQPCSWVSRYLGVWYFFTQGSHIPGGRALSCLLFRSSVLMFDQSYRGWVGWMETPPGTKAGAGSG